jgi:hypothetical protein
MKTIAFIIFLAAFQISQGGPIADQYFQQPRTNDLASYVPFAPPKYPSTNHGITEIGIERTPCFGSCPVYVCVVRNDGTVRYHGEANVDKLGDWDGTTDAYYFHQLANFIVDSGFADMPTAYSNNATDGETVYTTFVLKGRRKVFSNYMSSGPAKLWALQKLIDGLVADAAWQRGSGQPEGETNRTSAAAGSRLAATITANSVPKVTITNLLAHRKEFRGKRVEVTGYYQSGPELWSLYPSQADAKSFRNTGALWIMPFVKKGHEKNVKFVKEGAVRIVGVFDYNVRQPELGVGHLKQWPAQLVALEVFEELK